MAKRRRYPSDLSDARWELIEPVLAAWRLERRSRALDFRRPPEHDLRDIMDAILYVDRTGVQWAMTDLMARRLTSENTISWRDPKTTTEQAISG
ncbi:transposase [Streptomyces sp. NPDC087901]|uniref:transposase n=1 Tax=Streptomyces sp. NPDC087901 TaxID=3365818 RepID=UPI0037F7AA58